MKFGHVAPSRSRDKSPTSFHRCHAVGLPCTATSLLLSRAQMYARTALRLCTGTGLSEVGEASAVVSRGSLCVINRFNCLCFNGNHIGKSSVTLYFIFP